MAEGKNEGANPNSIVSDTIKLRELGPRLGLSNIDKRDLVKAIAGLSAAGVGIPTIIALLTGGTIAP